MMLEFKYLLLWYFVFLFSLVVHEASHAWAAMRLGDYTAHDEGQVTLDPAPHIRREPIGMVAVPLLSYYFYGWMMGWASAPVDFRWSLSNPKKSALVSLAGPLSNLGLALIAGVLIRLGMATNLLPFSAIVGDSQGGVLYGVAMILNVMFKLNIILFAFNLIPVPPLDGSGIIPLFFKFEEEGAKYLLMINNPTFSLIGMLLVWNFGGMLVAPVYAFFTKLLFWGF